MYQLLRSTIFQHPELLVVFAVCLKSCATNVSFDDIGWIHVTLQITLCGIGLRLAANIVLLAYLPSISASRCLISEIVLPDSIPHALDSCIDAWSSTYLLLPDHLNRQRHRDVIKSSSRSATLRRLFDQLRVTCPSWAAQPNFVAWMNFPPSTEIVTLLNNESF